MSFIIISVFSSLLSIPDHLNQNLSYWMRQLDSQSLDLQLTAIRRLQEIKDPTSIASLQREFDESNPEIRAAAARALGRFPFEEALKALEARLPKESDSYVRSELNRSVRGLKQTFKRQDEKASGSRPASGPGEVGPEDPEGLGE
jgi:hypothetical protein